MSIDRDSLVESLEKSHAEYVAQSNVIVELGKRAAEVIHRGVECYVHAPDDIVLIFDRGTTSEERWSFDSFRELVDYLVDTIEEDEPDDEPEDDDDETCWSCSEALLDRIDELSPYGFRDCLDFGIVRCDKADLESEFETKCRNAGAGIRATLTRLAERLQAYSIP